MKVNNSLILLSLFLMTLNINAQDLNIFTLIARSKEATFVSLSDIDRPKKPLDAEEQLDALSLQEITDIAKNNNDDFNYVKLSPEYRTQFLSRTNIAETDKIFIYSYLRDTLVSLPINALNAVAWLNGYTNSEECPCPDYYYQIGFEIDNNFLKGFEDHYANTLVFIGKRNPFVRNQVEPIIWQKIDSTEFPGKAITLEVNYNFGNNDFEYELGQSYKFENEKFQIFIQKLLKKDSQFGLRLLAINKKTKENIFEKLYYSGESASFAPLDYQWIGNLFRNKPMVIFGFQWHSFGCPIIDFIDADKKEIPINCDNRH